MTRSETVVKVAGRVLAVGLVIIIAKTFKEIYQFGIVQRSAEYANRQLLFEQAVERGCSVVSENIICPPVPSNKPIREKPFRGALAAKKKFLEEETK